MKIMTILGTRPEIIRLSLIIKKLDEIDNHILVHTGQNFTETLNDIFFKDLNVRKPDYFLGIKGSSFGDQIGQIIFKTEKLLIQEKPDKLLVLGDTNSGLCTIPAKRLGIPVYHIEAGNRCYDDRVPEEINRRIIDHTSDILMPYTMRSKENLVREGIPRRNIFIIGNPINEVINNNIDDINSSKILNTLKVKSDKYFLITIHRSENVDLKNSLENFVDLFHMIVAKYKIPIVLSLHPRTKSKMDEYNLTFNNSLIKHIEPVGFFDFIHLEKNALCVLSDSGTVQEECSIFGIPNITIRDVTERPETIECGSNIISGKDNNNIMKQIEIVTLLSKSWRTVTEYLEKEVSDKVIKILHSKIPI